MKSEWKVVVAVMLVVVASEAAFHRLQDNVSKDLAHIRSIPAIAKRLSEAASPRVLLLGNSYTRRDVQLDILREALAQERIAPQMVKVYPDSTAIAEWYYLLKRYFLETGLVPDVLVIGFTARNHLSDERSVDARLLSSRFCGSRDIREVFTHDIKTFPERVEFVLSHVSELFSNAGHIRRRVLAKVVPNYEDQAQMVNTALRDAAAKRAPAKPTQPTYNRLRRFLRTVERTPMKVVFVIMPAPDRQEFDEELLSILSENAILLDCRDVPELTQEDFIDTFYLDEEGGYLYTLYLAEKLAPVLASDDR